MAQSKEFSLKNNISLIISIASIAGWIFAAGIFYSEVKQTKKIAEQNHQLLMDQQQLNGKIIQFIKDK